METPAKYQVDMPTCPPSVQRAKIINSAYFQAVARIADSLIMAWGGLSPDPEENDELIETAIAFTDKLIEKVGERS